MTPPGLSPEGVKVQKQVQRQLGRCLMRIQQYEGIAKALAAHADVAGTANDMVANRDRRIEKASTASLGTLVKGDGTVFTNLRTLFTAGEPEPDALDDSKLPADQVAFAMRFRIRLAPEDHAVKIRELDAFVALRNRLVHHFMDDFDIFSDEGCAKALDHLHESFLEIDKQHNELRTCLVGMQECQQHVAVRMQTPEFHRLLAHESEQSANEIGP